MYVSNIGKLTIKGFAYINASEKNIESYMKN